MNNKTKQSARAAALDILCEQQKSGLPLDVICEKRLGKIILPDSRDNNLVMALISGVMRRLRYLDWLISTLSSHPLKKMKPLTINALRLGLLQIFFMDKIPAAAAINETIKALKKAGQPRWLLNFVNGVLRNAARKKKELQKKAKKEMSPAEHYSYPDWLFSRWNKRYGPAMAEKICCLGNTPPPLTLAVNSGKISAGNYLDKLAQEKIAGRAGELCRNSIYPNFKGDIRELPGFAQGLFHIQDEAAQLVVKLFKPLKPGNYLDCCAGLGGKTMQLGSMLPQGSSLLAVEPNKSRLKRLKENLKRLEMEEKVEIFNMTLAQFAGQTDTLFNYILVDAPCSGLGVIRRHPDIRWNRQPRDLITMQQTQLQLMTIAAGLLAPDGVMVYATCTIEPEENDEVVSRFLSAHPHMKISRPKLTGKAASLVDENNFLRTLPTTDHDGFFAVRLMNS